MTDDHDESETENDSGINPLTIESGKNAGSNNDENNLEFKIDEARHLIDSCGTDGLDSLEPTKRDSRKYD